MSDVATPNYMLKKDYVFGPYTSQATIPMGSFVRPIREEYVPKHCFKETHNLFYNKEADYFCYTHFGIVVIPKKYLTRIYGEERRAGLEI